MQYAKKDKTIILNIGSLVVNRLSFNNDIISFQTRFNSILYSIIIPILAIKIIYAAENGFGYYFNEEINFINKNREETKYSENKKQINQVNEKSLSNKELIHLFLKIVK
ncbi:MAG: ClpXP protease specificity-enhancing factor SspB [Candidatus Dasytiphilus stammeri]